VLDPTVTSGYIEIPNSTMYSISWGPLAIWVNGERGWFEICSPSPQFAEIFKQMQEAITLYYAILESFEDLKVDWEEYHAAPKNKRKRMQKPSVTLDDVLFKVGTPLITHPSSKALYSDNLVVCRVGR
jgi:hypothetical protein